MKAYLSCLCPFVLIFCKQPMIDFHWLQMSMENWFHLFLGTAMEMHLVVCLQRQCCTAILYMAAVYQLCVSLLPAGTTPATWIPCNSQTSGKESLHSSFHSLCALCMYVDGSCCYPVCWVCSEAFLPTGKAIGVANTPDSIGRNQTDTRSGFYLPACAGVVLCTYTCGRPTYFSLASASGNPPLFMVTAVTILSVSRTGTHPVQRAATLSGIIFQCLSSIKTWRNWKHWLYSANPSMWLWGWLSSNGLLWFQPEGWRSSPQHLWEVVPDWTSLCHLLCELLTQTHSPVKALTKTDVPVDQDPGKSRRPGDFRYVRLDNCRKAPLKQAGGKPWCLWMLWERD